MRVLSFGAGDIAIAPSTVSTAQISIVLAGTASDGSQDQPLGSLGSTSAGVLELAAANSPAGANGSKLFGCCTQRTAVMVHQSLTA